MKLSREQEAEYRTVLRVGRQDAVGYALTTLLEHDLERVKSALLSALAPDVAGLQGEARAYSRYLKYLRDTFKADDTAV